jgi:hypothetical protein
VSRPTDWAPLAAGDPVPGDPVEIQLLGRRHAELGDELEAQANMLRRLSQAEGWDADAGRRFASTAREIGDVLVRARRRYSAVADALRGYAPELAHAQHEADAALRDAQTAQSTIASSQPTPGPSPSTVDDAQTSQLADAQAALSRARHRMQDAVGQRDSAGRRAAGQIRSVIEHDGLADSWWDSVKDWTSDRWDSFITWVHEHADVIGKIADVSSWIATALATVAIVISFVPVLNVLAGPLLATAAAFTLVSLVAHTMLALSGDGSWVDVGFDVVALVTFGYGKVAIKSAQASEQALKIAATRAARKEAQKAARKALVRGSRGSRDSGGSLSRAARQARNSQVRRQGTRKAKQAVQEATATARPSAMSKVQNLDGPAAEQQARLHALAALAPRSARAQAASRAALTGLRRAALASGIGIGTDVIDKTALTRPIKPSFTFGRYANR